MVHLIFDHLIFDHLIFDHLILDYLILDDLICVENIIKNVHVKLFFMKTCRSVNFNVEKINFLNRFCF